MDSFSKTSDDLIKLWQEETGKFLNNPDFTKQMLETMQKMQNISGNASNIDANNDTACTTNVDDAKISELERRLANCESRLAFLEAERAADKHSK